jgi:hypothetical protein
MKKGIFAGLFLLPSALAHEEASKTTLLNGFTIQGMFIFSILLITLLSAIVIAKKTAHRYKKTIFNIIVLLAIIPTIFLLGSTIYTNAISITKGPVHWHADFEIWNCGEKLDLIEPRGLLNRIGTSLLHEHGDNRIHVEGVLSKESDIDLHSFFSVTGGSMTKDRFLVPTNQGIREMKNGDLCNGKDGKLQVFVYKVTNPGVKRAWKHNQNKIEDFEDYILSAETHVPPGDCIIIEFDQEKSTTDRICSSYALAIKKNQLEEEAE